MSEVDRSTSIKSFIRRGELARASGLLRRARQTSSSNDERISIDTELALLDVRQSRFRAAYETALRLSSELNLPTPSFFKALLVASLMALLYRFHSSRTRRFAIAFAAFAFRFRSDAQIAGPVEAVLWGHYWQDMRRSLSFNVMAAIAARDARQRIKAVAFINYTLAYMGFGIIGVAGLRSIIAELEVLNEREQVRDLLVWLGVAEQMNSESRACFATHSKFAKEFPDAEPFHQIISFASQVNTSISECGPTETSLAVDRCFSGSFALKESRNHVQIFGGKAALLALEARTDEARLFIERARDAAKRSDNRLDYLIFHRMAAVAALHSHEYREALEHIRKARGFLKNYARIMWYLHEFNRIEMIARYQLNPGLASCFWETLVFAVKSLCFPNIGLIKKPFALSRQTWRSRLVHTGASGK